MALIQIIGLEGENRDADLLVQIFDLGLDCMRNLGVRPAFEDLRTSDWDVGVVGMERLPGEVGCRKAHLLAAKRLLDSTRLFDIVLEDDARLTERFRVFEIETFFGRHTTRPTVLLLGSKFRVTPSSSQYQKSKESPFGRVHVPPSYSFAYAINRPAAQILVNSEAKFGLRGHADWPPELVNTAKFYRAIPDFAAVNLSATSTIDRKSLKAHPWGKRVFSLVRGILTGNIEFAAAFKILVLRNLLLKSSRLY